MDYIPFIVMGAVSILLLVIGIAIKYFKAYWLISGYNTMSEEKKKNVDIVSLGNFVAKILFIMAGIFIISTILLSLGQEMIGLICLFLIMPLSIYTVIKTQTFDRNTKNEDGTFKRGTKVLIAVVVGLFIITTVGIVTLIYFSSEPPEYIIQDESLRISGMYGEEIKFSEITDITLEGQMPKIEFKSNGSSIGSKKKGFFKLEGIGRTKLFVDTEIPPYIFINSESGLRIINTNDSE